MRFLDVRDLLVEGGVVVATIDEPDCRLTLVSGRLAWTHRFELTGFRTVVQAIRGLEPVELAPMLQAMEFDASETTRCCGGLLDELVAENKLLEGAGLDQLRREVVNGYLYRPSDFHTWAAVLYGCIGPDFEPSRLVRCERYRPISLVVSALEALAQELASDDEGGGEAAPPSRRPLWEAYTHSQWLAEAERRFGPNEKLWGFRCPACGTYQRLNDWFEVQAPLAAVAVSCVRRWLDTPPSPALADRLGDDVGVCAYRPTPEFQLNPVRVTMPDGSVVRVFEFADDPETHG